MYKFKPIGYVRNEFKDYAPPDDFIGTLSRIVVHEEYEEGLYKLDEFERIFVLYVFARSVGFKLVIHPRGDTSRPKRGVFATRSPFRRERTLPVFRKAKPATRTAVAGCTTGSSRP